MDASTSWNVSTDAGVRDPVKTAWLVEATCRGLGCEGSVRCVHVGPLVTTFEFDPRVGDPRQDFDTVADRLGMALSATPVLVQRFSGPKYVSIQIPNPRRESIPLVQLLESPACRRSIAPLGVALGTTVLGDPYIVDLAALPHLLIAAASGMDASVGLAGILIGLLRRTTSRDMRVVLIDPVRSKLSAFDGAPHLLRPLVSSPHEGVEALRWTVGEMDRRYAILAAAGARNIEQFNRTTHPSSAGRLPFIVIAVGELAELMMAAPRLVERSIARLAQMSRAVGIHLALATGDFSLQTVTGLLKANLPARLAFRVRTRVESRVILDCSGAERLMDKGDLLFLPPASRDCLRLHGPYVSDEDIAGVLMHARSQPATA